MTQVKVKFENIRKIDFAWNHADAKSLYNLEPGLLIELREPDIYEQLL